MNEELTEKLNQARLLKRHFKLAETVAVLKECLTIDPDCLIAAAQAGLCLLLQGKPQEAESFFQKAFDGSEKTDLPVGAYLAACMTALNKESEAENLLETIRDKQSGFSAAETYMLAAEASVAIAEKEYEKAYALTVRALQSGGASYPLLAAQQHWLAMNK